MIALIQIYHQHYHILINMFLIILLLIIYMSQFMRYIHYHFYQQVSLPIFIQTMLNKQIMNHSYCHIFFYTLRIILMILLNMGKFILKYQFFYIYKYLQKNNIFHLY